MVKKKVVPKTKNATSPIVEEVVIPKVEEKAVKKQSVQSKNQASQSGA